MTKAKRNVSVRRSATIAAKETPATLLLEDLKKDIDELGQVILALACVRETLKKEEKLEKRIKEAMAELNLMTAKGQFFEAERTLTPTERVDLDAVKRILGRKVPMKPGVNVSLGIRPQEI